MLISPLRAWTSNGATTGTTLLMSTMPGNPTNLAGTESVATVIVTFANATGTKTALQGGKYSQSRSLVVLTNPAITL